MSGGLQLRYAAELPYWHQREGDDKAEVIHKGPAMLAAVTDGEGLVVGCHVTWIDPARPGDKLALADPDKPGETLEAKKLRGTKRKGAIRLVDPPGATRLVIGEGIETVLSAYVAERDPERTGSDESPVFDKGRAMAHGLRRSQAPTSAYWAALDLGHLAGKAARSIAHPTKKDARGRTMRVGGPWPEIQAEKELDVPHHVTEIVLIGDADSDRFATEMALRRAAARWARPGRTIKIAWPPDGVDLNDVLRGVTSPRAKHCEGLVA